MNWMEGIGNAVAYIEAHLKENITMEEIAKEAYVSNFYFQKAFSLLCGFSVAEYIRFRRLSLAGSDMIATDKKIIDIALEYGYDSPDSFTRAFTRFHGVTPTVVRRERAMIKSFAPLKIYFTLKGGSTMDYKVVEKEAFTVMGVARRFLYETSKAEIPEFWMEHYKSKNCEIISGIYGISMEDGEKDSFKYLIADNYLPWLEMPEEFEIHVIPRSTWAVFSCVGALPDSLQEINAKIFSEWLPNNNQYEIAARCFIERYTDSSVYEKGTRSEDYYSEIWVPVRKKQEQN